MSTDLQWLLLKPYHSFLIKRDGASFSREPLNPTNIHRKKYTGIINPYAVGISRTDDSFELIAKDGDHKSQFKPKQAIKRQPVTSPEQLAERTNKLQPSATPYVVGRYQRLQQASSGKVPASYTKKRRHQRRATESAKRRAIPKNTLVF